MPAGSTRLLAAIRSLAPVIRPSVLMGDRNKINVFIPDAVDDVVRKSGNDPLAKATGKRRACFGARQDALRGLLDRRKEAEPKSFKACLIELHRRADFRPSLRVEYRLLHERSFARS